MSRFKSIVCAILLFPLCAAGVASADTATPQTISLRADFWFPFNGNPAAEKPGYMIEIAKRVFEKEGIQVDYKIAPWARSIKDVESGLVDGIVGTGKSETPTFVFPDESLGIVRYSFFTLASSKRAAQWQFAGLDSLKKISLGIIADYSYAETVDSYIKEHQGDEHLIQTSRGDDALDLNIKKLQRNRIDVLISTPEVFYSSLDSLKLARSDFRLAGSAPEQDPLYIAFSPAKSTSKHYAQLLNDGIATLRRTGELKRILDSYHLSDWN